MQIQKGNFKWKAPLTPLDLNNIDSIAIHHMYHPTADEYEVESWHLSGEGNFKDFIGFAYNFWIGFDGIIIEGRGFNRGAGVFNNNSHIISVGLQGDFMSQNPTHEQLNSLKWLISYLKSKIPSIRKIDGHKAWNNTSCPGDNFPLEQFREDDNMDWDKKNDLFIKHVQKAVGCQAVDGKAGVETVSLFDKFVADKGTNEELTKLKDALKILIRSVE
ncbi:MAG: peptidoglycan recognition family protein [Candidatus Odinarchaeota archaeon]